jgi:4'-phosphopantetheinyl transferase
LSQICRKKSSVDIKPWIWETPTEKPKLARNQVHVWRICLNDATPLLKPLISILSADEKNRAEKYRFIGDRNNFIAGRGVLRIILGSYLDIKPGKLRFSYGPYEKPLLVTQRGEHSLQFNISRSHGLGLCAVTQGRKLGVDLEKICPSFINQQIPEHFFSHKEAAKLRALPVSFQEKAFFNCWTRKEAFLKAKGSGLSSKLDQFEVSLAPEEPVALLDIYDDPKERDHWSLIDIDPGPGFAAALAIEGLDLDFKCFQWEAVNNLLN